MPIAAVIQMCSSDQISENLLNIDSYLQHAKAAGAVLVLLPENCFFMGIGEEDKYNIGETFNNGSIQAWVSQRAKALRLWIVVGSMPIKGMGKRVRASSLVFDERGRCVARYDKIHLFDVCVSKNEQHQESRTIERGNELVVVDTPIGRLGLSICYDLRFPELYQALACRGAEIFAIPSAFTAVTGLAHWEVLLRARAIENQCYVLAANQWGAHTNGRQTYGHSLIVEPWGKIIACQPEGAGMVYADIDRQQQARLRQQFPCGQHHVLPYNQVFDSRKGA